MKVTTPLEQRLYKGLKELTRFMTPNQARRAAKNSGLEYEEFLEMAYENMQSVVKQTLKGVKS